MTHVFFFEGQIIVDALSEAREKIAKIANPEFGMVRNRTINQLSQTINKIRFDQMGLEPEFFEVEDVQAQVNVTPKPLTKVLGVDLVKPQPQMTAQQVEVQALKKQVEQLREKFLDMQDEKILDQTPEIVIRGLGKSLGMLYTEQLPERITLVDVQKIRERLMVVEGIKEDGDDAS